MLFNRIIEKYKRMSLPMKAAFWYVICNFFNKGIALLSTPIFTRILTEEQYGTFSIFQSWFNILIIFTSLNIFMSSYTKGLILFEKDKKGFTSSLLSLTCTITLVLFVIYITNIPFWTNIFELPPLLMTLMFLELLTMPALEFWMARQRFDYSYKKVVIVSLTMNFLCLVLSVVFVCLSKNKLEMRVLSDILVKSVFCIPILIYIYINGKKFFNRDYWKYALKFNIPLIPHYLSNYVLNQSDRIMIAKMVGKIQAAYYSVAYTISTILMLLVQAVNNALTPYIYKSIKEEKTDEIRYKINPIIILMGALSIIVMALGPEIIYVFAGKNYMESIYIIPPVAASIYFVFIYSMFSTVEYYYQKTGRIAVATSISAVLNLLLNYVCIKIWGYCSAGYTTLICYICLSIFHYIFYKNILKKELPKVKNIYDVKIMFGVGVLILILMIMMLFVYKIILLRYLFLTLIIVYAIIKKGKIKEIILSFKKE